MYYVYKDKYEEKKDDLNKDDIKKFDNTKLRLTDDYLYESEKKKEQTDKKSDKKEPPTKPTKRDVNKFS